MYACDYVLLIEGHRRQIINQAAAAAAAVADKAL